jgi:hypothetical protein
MTARLALVAIAARLVVVLAIGSANAVPMPQPNAAVAGAPMRSSPGAEMMFDDKLFEKVSLETSEQNACSPTDPGTNWRGVILRAPSQVFLPDPNSPRSALTIPLCGLYFVDVPSALRHPGPMVLIVVDDISGDVYRGAIATQDPHPTIPPPPSPPLDPALYANQAYGSYFNVDVASYVALPLRPARYRLIVEYAGHRSNEVHVEVVQRK